MSFLNRYQVTIEEQNEIEQAIKKDNLNTNPFYIKRGRPKEYLKEQHYFTARINDDLWELAKKKAKEEYDNSVNLYLNTLIAKDHGLM